MADKKRRQLHQSGAEMLSKCGKQFEFRYIEGRKRPPNAFLVCGTATDTGVSLDLNTKIDTGELAPEDVILDAARDAVEKYPDKQELQIDGDDEGKSLETVLGETKDKAVRLLRLHHGEVAPAIQPFQVARKFSINLDAFLRSRARELHEAADNTQNKWRKKVLDSQGAYLNAAVRDGGYDFVGEQDIVEKWEEPHFLPRDGGTPMLVIRDTKTSGKSPTSTIADESEQLTYYAVASHVLDGKLPDLMKLDYLVDLKRGPKSQTVTSKRTLEDVDVALNRIANAVATIRSGMFTPTQQTNWWCSEKWCAYTAICPYFKKPKVIQITTELTGTAEERKPVEHSEKQTTNGSPCSSGATTTSDRVAGSPFGNVVRADNV